jgi:murein DD-endopeptidase MepM/ murein hydrolase activator NlpD
LSQSRAQLERERLQIIDKIEFITSILKKKGIDKENAVLYYNSLQLQIKNRESMLSNLKMQISNLNSKITENKSKLDSFRIKIDELKEKQSSLVRNIYLNTITKNKYIFLFSSKGWEEYLDRKRYIKQYNKYILNEVNAIRKEEIKIKAMIRTIDADKLEVEKLIFAENENLRIIKEESSLRSKVLKDISQNEAKYISLLDIEKKHREALNKSIENVIIDRLRNNTEIVPEPENKMPEESFSQLKSKLGWPVSNGYISARFGKHAHPGISGVYTNNSGIDIISNPNETVRAIYGGEVAGLMYINGYNWMVILKHGEYYSVYSKLETVNISKGDSILKNQPVGKISDNGEFHFEIWHLKTKLNPELWLNKTLY